METKTCDTCKHWAKGFYGKAASFAPCNHPKLDGGTGEDSAGPTGWECDGFETGPKFGCIHHEVGVYDPNPINEDRVKEAVRLMDAVFDSTLIGGILHIAIADGNMEDHHLDMCEETLRHAREFDDSPEQIESEKACLTHLRKCTLRERLEAFRRLDSGEME